MAWITENMTFGSCSFFESVLCCLGNSLKFNLTSLLLILCWNATVKRVSVNDSKRRILLKETSNAKPELVLLEWTLVCVSAFVLYNIWLINIFIVAIYDVTIIRCVWQSWLHLMLNWMKYKTLNLILRWKFLSVYYIPVFLGSEDTLWEKQKNFVLWIWLLV